VNLIETEHSVPVCSHISADVWLFVDRSGWTSGVDDHFVAVAEYDFDAQNDDELSFKQGSLLTIAPKGVLPLFILFAILYLEVSK